ncbi:amino acid adenylation domain-containing protein [Cohnella suwonensis]|uniref:Amino acid adenylation domain-containing protein n=1 Tax=Cohnella suwonensis TaxID=696072 RepID=A0ABW0LSW4_9BACL
MKPFAHMTDVLEYGAASGKGIVFIHKKSETRLSYRELYDRSLDLATRMRARGWRPRDEIVIRIEDPQSFITAFWGCLLGGFIPVPLTAGGSEDHRTKLLHVWRLLNRPKLLGESDHASDFADESEDGPRPEQCHSLDGLLAEPTGEPVSAHEDDLPYRSDGSEIAFIQFSSGSTGEPKGVMLTHANLLSNMEAIVACSGTTSRDSSLSWMPLTHDMGLIGFHLAPIYAGMEQYLMQPAQFMLDPMLWLAKAHEHRVTSIASPNFGYKHFLGAYKPEQAEGWDLSCVRLIFNGAEPISAEWAERFLMALEKHGLHPAAMFPVYGMAEATLAVTFPPAGERLVAVRLDPGSLKIGERVLRAEVDDERAIAFVDVGFPVADCEVRICGDSGASLPEGMVGHIDIRGKNVTAGYYNAPEATERASAPGGWLRTGDVGYMQSGRLVITGRFKDIIFVRGQNVYPHDLEKRAEAVEGVGYGKAAACGATDPGTGEEEIVLFVQHRGRLEKFVPLAERVRRQLNRETGLDIGRVLPIRSIPRTTSGKIQRFKLAERLAGGEWDEASSELESLRHENESAAAQSVSAPERVEHPDLLRLKAVWRDVLGTAAVGTDDHFQESGGNSLKAAQALAGIRKEWGVELSLRDLYDYPTPRKLMERIRSENGRPSADGGALPPALSGAGVHGDLYPSSVAQKRMALVEQSEHIGCAYHIPVALSISGPLSADALIAVLRSLTERHETLRTSFHWEQGELVQRVHPNGSVEPDIAVIHCDAADFPDENRLGKDDLAGLTAPFDLTRDPMLRARVWTDGWERHLLLLNVHHIASDGIGMNVLMKEFAALLNGETLPPPNRHYKDYAVWENGAEERPEAEAYWREELRAPLPVLHWPDAGARPAGRTFKGGTVKAEVPSETAWEWERLARTDKATMSSLLLGLHSFVVHRYSLQTDLSIGLLLAGRTHPDTANMVGMFNNYVPVRLAIDDGRTFRDFWLRTRDKLWEALGHSDVSYERLIELSGQKPDRSRNPLFDTMLVYHNQSEAAFNRFEAAGCRFVQLPVETGTAKLDLKLDVYPEPSGALACVWEFDERLFRRETVERMAGHFVRLAETLVREPERKLGDISLLSDDERRQVVEEFNDTKAAYPEELTLPELFRRQAERTPERTAAVFEAERLTYRELDARANRIARALLDAGLAPEQPVGLMAERSPEMLAGLLGILKAGGAYVPLPPEFPEERLRFMAEDSGIRLICAQRRWMSAAEKAAPEAERIDLDDARWREGMAEALEALDTRADALAAGLATAASPDGLAYILYTSGSTGRPKGVMIRHRSVVNRLHWMQKAYPLGADDVILQKTPYSFDVSVWELFWWMLAGASVAFLPPGAEKDPGQLIEAIARHRVTTMHFVPSMLAAFLESAHAEPAGQLREKLATLKRVFASGEALHRAHADRFFALTHTLGLEGAKLVNLYGPTEATVDVTVHECEADCALDFVPIGRPIDNTSVYIVGGQGQAQPIGVPGELCIAGIQLARGYANRPDLTAEKFVPNPFVPNHFVQGSLMYRTGDLARWMEDGQVQYLGRIDDQVKIRGYRIELGEIERTLLLHEAVSEAAVAVRDDGAGDKRLVGYVVADRACTSGELRTHCAGRLPDYMIPATFVQLQSMPLTASGKADRKALPEPETEMATGTAYAAPESETEEKLAALWRELLRREEVGIDDDFFELGGHSLKAAELTAAVHKQFECALTLREVFDRPTVRRLASLILERRATGEVRRYSPIAKAERRPYYPLASAQNRLFVLQSMDENSTAYHLPSVLTIRGELDRSRLSSAVRALSERHEMLRASFDWENGQPVMRIAEEPFAAIEFAVAEPSEDPDACLRSFIRPFRLNESPLLRVKLVRMPEEDVHLLLLDAHHLVADGVSMAAMARQFMELYEGKPAEALPVQYKDYAAWQSEWLRSEACGDQERYWLRTLSGDIPALQLPYDFARPQRMDYEGDQVSFSFDAGWTHELAALCARTGTTPYMVLLGLYTALLHRYTGQNDIWIGSPTAGRPHADLADLIGMFVNTVVIRGHASGDQTFGELLEQAKDRVLGALDNDRYPFEELVDKLAVRRDVGRNPLFDVMFVLQNTGMPAVACGETVFEPFEFRRTTAKFDLTLEIVEQGDDWRCRFEYRTSLFRRETVERMAGHFVRLAETLVREPERKLGDVDLMSAEERRQVVETFNDTKAAYPEELTLPEMFRRQAERTPERTAAAFEAERLTYRELDARANRIARALLDAGLAPEQPVGLMAERSPEMLAGLLGILKAGGAYVPLPPEFPEERLRFMAEDSGIRLICAQRRWLSAAEKAAPVAVRIDLDDARWREVSVSVEGLADAPDADALANGLAAGRASAASPDGLAYILYTSGSTGRPKGVMIGHRSVVNRLHWMQKAYPLGADDVILQKTPYSFDVSVWELFWWMLAGASVAFLPPGAEKDPGQLIEAIARRRVTTMHFVPSMLAAFLETAHAEPAGQLREKLATLKRVFASGEALHRAHADRFFALTRTLGLEGAKLVNLYGPTEATVDVTVHECEADSALDFVPIGRPIDNTSVYIVGEQGQAQPIGVPGELCIAGVQLARGYANRPELTAEKFVPNPFAPGSLMYRTGDLARWMEDGQVQYLGRIDDQVKIRGYRIELGEIERTLLLHEAVSEAAVAVRDDGAGDKRLVGYVVADRACTSGELRAHCAGRLPDYMIPAAFVQLESMPLTASGKADRKALPEPEAEMAPGTAYAAPESETEEKLVALWRELLRREEVGIDDDFFELGGHSLKAAALTARIEQVFSVRLSLKDVFMKPTVRGLASLLSSGMAERSVSPIPRAQDKPHYPVTSAQKQMLIHEKRNPGGLSYHMPAALLLTGMLDDERLRLALKGLAARHESLRTSFDQADGLMVQAVREGIDVPFQRIDEAVFFGGGTEEWEQAALRWLRPFELSKAPLFRAGLVPLGEDRHLLLFDIHHAVSDGMTNALLNRDLVALYEDRPLPDVKAQFKDYGEWLSRLLSGEERERHRDYWLNRFADGVPQLELPTDSDRAALADATARDEGKRYRFAVSGEVAAALERLARQSGCTLSMVLLASYQAMLAYWSGTPDVVTGVPSAGRSHPDLADTAGLLLQILAIRGRPISSLSFESLLADTKTGMLQAFDHPWLPADELVELLDERGLIRWDPTRHPLYDTMFVMQNMDAIPAQSGDLAWEPLDWEFTAAKTDLVLQAEERGGKLELSFEYRSRLFYEETVAQMAEGLLKFLEQAAAEPQASLGKLTGLRQTSVFPAKPDNGDGDGQDQAWFEAGFQF